MEPYLNPIRPYTVNKYKTDTIKEIYNEKNTITHPHTNNVTCFDCMWKHSYRRDTS